MTVFILLYKHDFGYFWCLFYCINPVLSTFFLDGINCALPIKLVLLVYSNFILLFVQTDSILKLYLKLLQTSSVASRVKILVYWFVFLSKFFVRSPLYILLVVTLCVILALAFTIFVSLHFNNCVHVARYCFRWRPLCCIACAFLAVSFTA